MNRRDRRRRRRWRRPPSRHASGTLARSECCDSGQAALLDATGCGDRPAACRVAAGTPAPGTSHHRRRRSRRCRASRKTPARRCREWAPGSVPLPSPARGGTAGPRRHGPQPGHAPWRAGSPCQPRRQWRRSRGMLQATRPMAPARSRSMKLYRRMSLCSSGRLRPKRSDGVPWVICPTAKPANHAASVSWAEPVGAWKNASMPGKAGKYMSVLAGPTAVRKPSSRGSHEGNVMHPSLQGACQMASVRERLAYNCQLA